VVFMFVGEKERIQPLDVGQQHLLPKVGARVDNNTFAVNFYVYRSP